MSEAFSLFIEPPRRGHAFAHDRSENTKHEWLTDPPLIRALGAFDLDPCAPVPEIRPWDTAAKHYDIETDGLLQSWFGRVWLNPPYDNAIAGRFLSRMAEHGNGVALVYARTETENFFNYIWGGASSILFIRGRLSFWEIQCAVCGAGGSKHTEKFECKSYTPSKAAVRGSSAGAPSVLVAYGEENSRTIARAATTTIPGHWMPINR